MLRKRQKRLFVLGVQFLDRHLVDVVLTLRVLLTPVPQMLVEVLHGRNRGNRHKRIAAAVADFVLYVAFLVAGGGITELRMETVMEHEPLESVRKDTVCALQHLHHSRGHVVKAQVARNTANVLKDPLHPFQQALLVLRGKCLRVSLVGMWEGQRQRITLLFSTFGVIVNMFAKVHLPISGNVLQRNVAVLLHPHEVLLLADILLDCGVSAGKAMLIPEPREHAHCRVALLLRNLAVFLQPGVNDGDERSQYWIALWLDIQLCGLVPIVAGGIFPNRSKIMAGLAGDLSKTKVFIFVEISDIICLSHS